MSSVTPRLRGGEEAERQPRRTGDDREDDRRLRLELARGDGPEPLARVQPVLLDVADVVDEVDRRAHQAERDEGEGRGEQDVALEEPARGEGCGEDEDVLDPLARAHGPDRRREPGPPGLLEELLLRDDRDARGVGLVGTSTAGAAAGSGGAGREVADRGEVSVIRSPIVSARTDNPSHVSPRGYPRGVRTPRVLRGAVVALVLGAALTGCAAGSVPDVPAASSPAPTPTGLGPGRRRQPRGARLRERSRRPRVRPRRGPAQCAGRPAEQRDGRPGRPVRGRAARPSTGGRRWPTASPSPPTTRRPRR